MVEVKATTKRVGDSIAVFIPADVARAEGIEEGQVVYLTVRTAKRRTEGLVGKHEGVGAFRRGEVGWE